jgi:trehalose-phosphatase
MAMPRVPEQAKANDVPTASCASEPSHIADWLVGRHRLGEHLLLLTDYDGTLSPIVDSPAEAWLPGDVRASLEVLARRPRVHLAVVSGRDLADLRARVALPGAIYAGCHGLEIEGPGMKFVHPDAAAQQDALRAISRRLSERAHTVPGMLVEPKRFGLAVHYRRVAIEQIKRVEVELARALPQDGSRLKLFHGSRVIEVQPQVSWTKGDCALWIRDVVARVAGAPMAVLYMGDDWTDEHAFEALGAGAVTIKIGGGTPASRAAHRMPDVASVQRFLAELAARTGGGAA